MQKTSLKEVLLSEAKRAYPGGLRMEDIERIAHREGKKVDNATRRLRELMNSGFVEAVRNEKAVIIGYRYKNTERVAQISEGKAEQTQKALFEMRPKFY